MHVSTEQLVEATKERFAVQDYHGAVHLLEDVAGSGRGFADVHHLLGLSYHMLGQSERALASLDRALALNSRYVEALLHRALVLDALGRSLEAAQALGRARELGGAAREGIPAQHAAKLANMHASLAEAYAETGVMERAIDQYRRALELGPGFHDLRYRLARLLLEAGRAPEAREELQHVVAARPQFYEARAALGLVAYVSGDLVAARAAWAGLQRERPEDPRVRAYLKMLDRARAS